MDELFFKCPRCKKHWSEDAGEDRSTTCPYCGKAYVQWYKRRCRSLLDDK